MKKIHWQLLLGASLLLLSAIAYYTHYLIFQDTHHIFIYMVGDIGFVFIEVLMVTLIIDRLLREQERRRLRKKINMIIGVFFSEVGGGLLKLLAGFDSNAQEIGRHMIVRKNWRDRKYLQVHRQLQGHLCSIDTERGNLGELRGFLTKERTFLVNLLQNPSILEDEEFSDLLWAVFHIAEELEVRTELTTLCDTDAEHLAGDIHRAYLLLLQQWVLYMRYLKKDYPYLFSLAIRTNPFDPDAQVEVTI